MKPKLTTVYFRCKLGQGHTHIIDDGSNYNFPAKEIKEYFFTPEQLNEYTQSIIKETLNEAAENAEIKYEPHWSGKQEGSCYVNKQSIINLFDKLVEKWKV